MTEKRFTMTYGKYHDNLNDKEYDEKLESWKICELLNELHEENQQLKKREHEIKNIIDNLEKKD